MSQVQVELTAKKWKAVIAAGTTVAIVSAVIWITLLCLAMDTGPTKIEVPLVMIFATGFLTIAGLLLRIYGRAMAWWHHG